MNDGDSTNENDFLADLSFSPQWAKESATSHSERLGKRAERFASRDGDGDDRRGRDRDRRGPRGDRPPFRGDRRDRPPREGGDRPPREGRPPFHGDRPPRDGRPPFHGDRPREPAPFGIRFLPEHKALGLIARKVAQGRRAMPLRELVALFFKNPASALVRVEFDEAHKDDRFHQCTACGWFARNPEALLAHQLSAHFEDRFEAREIEVEPPKGKYTTVARCGVTGRLLAPPNDHSYNRRVLEMLRDPACAGLSEAEYRARIELVSDPALVEEWRAAQTKKTVFVRKERPAPKPKAPAATEAPEAPEAPAPETPASEAPAPEAVPAPEAAEAPAEAPEAPVPEAPAAEEEPAPAAPPPRTYDREEAEALFRAEAAPRMTRVSRAVSAPHAVLEKLSDRYVQGEIRRAWERESRSHVPSLFFAVRGGLKAFRLALFRASDPARTDFVAPRTPVPLDASTAVPELRAILDFVASAPGCTREALFAAVVPADADDARRKAFLDQFAFAVDRGHLIAYANGTLALAADHPFYRAAPETHAEPAPAEASAETHAESVESAEPAPAEAPAETHAESAESAEPAPAEAPAETHAESAEPAPAEAPAEAHAESAEPAPAEAPAESAENAEAAPPPPTE